MYAAADAKLPTSYGKHTFAKQLFVVKKYTSGLFGRQGEQPDLLQLYFCWF